MPDTHARPLISLPVRTLRAIASAASAAVEAKMTSPILANIALTTGEKHGQPILTLVGTNLDIETAASCTLDAGQASMKTTLPGRMLAEIAGRLNGDGRATLTIGDDGWLTVACGRTRYVLATLPHADFPMMQVEDFKVTLELPGNTLAAAIRSCLACASIEETRYYLNGAYLHATRRESAPGQQVLALVSTDGRKLALSVFESNGAAIPAPEGMPGIIIPRTTLPMALALAETAGEGVVEIAISEAKVRFTDADAGRTITSKTIDGTFPEYGRVIPATSGATAVTLSRVGLEALADRLVRVATDKLSRSHFTPEDAGLAAAAGAPADGVQVEDWIAATVDGPPAPAFTVNGKYLKALAASLPGDQVILYLPADSGNPIRLAPTKAGGHPNPHETRVIMPIRAG